MRNEIDSNGDQRYCYLTPDGSQSPNLRLHPGDLLILDLKNNLVESAGEAAHAHNHGMQNSNGDPCLSGKMTAVSTNLHFHGLVIPPTCHQDEVLKTSISPGDTPFEYRIRIPVDQAPGLYWYHPHIHGFSRQQVLGGASGAIIIEGLERTDKALPGLRERVLIIRDQNLLNPNAPPSKNEPVIPQIRVDRDGDVVNTGNGFGKPAKDLSINFVPVPYPDYPPATIEMRPGERQLWRVLNAGAITYLNLQILHDRVPQMLQIVALDGVTVNENGKENDRLAIRNHLGLPPGGRVEFIVDAPPAEISATLVTRVVNTGPGGENDPNRPLAKIVIKEDAPEPKSILSTNPDPAIPQSLPWLGDVAPVRTRKLYFSETPQDPKDPNSPTTFYITVDGQTPTPFDPSSNTPSIVAKQGDVEDWIIENRSNELHAFHIHQVHFLMMDWNGIAVNEPFLRDTINVPFFDGKMEHFPSVRLRMDFRAPSVVGTFFFHCHLLEHEDNGMMGLIRVDPPDAPTPSTQSKALKAAPTHNQN
ncbi:MAG TPA: multicopper oxidase family protein [Candidatus Acidoferrum sp.]|nr:multicopper oxidase family protein [Candidatus Acidoferrum sp.]